MNLITPVINRWIQEAREDPDGFWARAATQLPWFRTWDRVFEWTPPTFRWFIGGETNLAYNALDHHVKRGRGEHTALIYFNERGERKLYTYARLLREVERIAAALRGMGINAMRFSGAYSYRMAKVGRLSLHAYGLALDVHEVTAEGKSFVVAKDFAKGLPNGCASNAPLLNRLACRFAELRLFQELLTPDSNADHRDHLHIAIARAPD